MVGLVSVIFFHFLKVWDESAALVLSASCKLKLYVPPEFFNGEFVVLYSLFVLLCEFAVLVLGKSLGCYDSAKSAQQGDNEGDKLRVYHDITR